MVFASCPRPVNCAFIVNWTLSLFVNTEDKQLAGLEVITIKTKIIWDVQAIVSHKIMIQRRNNFGYSNTMWLYLVFLYHHLHEASKDRLLTLN